VTVLKVLINLILVQKFILFIFQSLSLRDKRKTHLKIDEKKRKFSLNHNSTIKKNQSWYQMKRVP
jgi:low affinity Fe/Cu permease